MRSSSTLVALSNCGSVSEIERYDPDDVSVPSLGYNATQLASLADQDVPGHLGHHLTGRVVEHGRRIDPPVEATHYGEAGRLFDGLPII